MTKKKLLKRKIKVALKRKSKIFTRSFTKKKELILVMINKYNKTQKITHGRGCVGAEDNANHPKNQKNQRNPNVKPNKKRPKSVPKEENINNV